MVTDEHTPHQGRSHTAEGLWLSPTNIVTQETLRLDVLEYVAGAGALIHVNAQPQAIGVQQEVAARGGVATVEPPPDEADVSNIQNGEPTSVEAFLDTGVGPTRRRPRISAALATATPGSANGRASAVAGPSCFSFQPPSHRSNRPPSIARPKSLSSECNEPCQPARQSADSSNAPEDVDPAQYDLLDGNEAAAMVELKSAAPSPTLKFAAPRERVAVAPCTNGVA